ncbi:MAG TPA: hypothetical protein PLB01_08580 [Thermoanaerobaculia bacterium]|nr:hypothetical protein [Thermoanaerobaculia bacterium]
MKIRRTILASLLSAVLLLATSPLPAQTYTLTTQAPQVTTMTPFQINVYLAQPTLCGTTKVLLPKGAYAVKIESLGAGSVRATFTGNGKTCQNPGTLTASSGNPLGGTTSSYGTTTAGQSFAAMGFTPQSQVVTQTVGTKLNVIVKGLGTNQILIGLTLPS